MAIYALATGEKVVEWMSAWSLVDGALFLVIAYGIYRESRVAAVVGLLFYLLTHRLDRIGSIVTLSEDTLRP